MLECGRAVAPWEVRLDRYRVALLDRHHASSQAQAERMVDKITVMIDSISMPGTTEHARLLAERGVRVR